MVRQCCGDGRTWRRRARLSRAAASFLPGAVLVLLPKCPLCLAGWLTIVTGVGFSAAGAARVRAMLLVLCAAAVTLAVAPVFRRRTFRRAPEPVRCRHGMDREAATTAQER
jgi:hypothetical protein